MEEKLFDVGIVDELDKNPSEEVNNQDGIEGNAAMIDIV